MINVKSRGQFTQGYCRVLIKAKVKAIGESFLICKMQKQKPTAKLLADVRNSTYSF